MTLDDLLPFFGCSELDAGLAALLKAGGADIASLSMKKLRTQGMEGIELPALGLALTFNEREDYIRTYASPKDAGQAVMVAAFAYGAGSKTFKAYAGSIPFASGPVTDRDSALAAFGTPARTEEDDGEIEWDQWLLQGLQVRATYRADGTLKVLMYSVPFKG